MGSAGPGQQELRPRPGPVILGGVGTAFAFIPVSIGALTGVAKRDAGVASGLLTTSQNLGGAIGVAVTSSIATAHSRVMASHGYPAAAARTGGLHWAMWACGLVGLAAIPVVFALIRRVRKPHTLATAPPQERVPTLA